LTFFVYFVHPAQIPSAFDIRICRFSEGLQLFLFADRAVIWSFKSISLLFLIFGFYDEFVLFI